MQHPVYKEYTANEEGKVYRSGRQLGMTVCKDQKNKLMMTVYKPKSKSGKKVYAHRFIFECKIGRELTRSDLVTFIDKNVSNVKPNNLYCAKYAAITPLSEEKREEIKEVTMKMLNEEPKKAEPTQMEKELEQKIKSKLDLSDILDY